jgi:hypothetical protein
VLRRHWRQGSLIVGVVWLLGPGCGSSTAPAPIPDPGGPFQTSVPPNTSLSALTIAQSQELCNEVSAAEQAYLAQAIIYESTCRMIGIEGANLSVNAARDGGADGGSWLSACQGAYDSCEKDQKDNLPVCELPPGCGATVELLSACLNEIANTDPVATCLTTPTCAMFAAAGPTTPDAGISSCGSGSGPPLLACARLQQQCPAAVVFNPY